MATIDRPPNHASYPKLPPFHPHHPVFNTSIIGSSFTELYNALKPFGKLKVLAEKQESRIEEYMAKYGDAEGNSNINEDDENQDDENRDDKNKDDDKNKQAASAFYEEMLSLVYLFYDWETVLLDRKSELLKHGPIAPGGPSRGDRAEEAE
ncbi:MAG: hypothetical protein Q9168_007747 [Polycauliona sp. 1 TL-2023]